MFRRLVLGSVFLLTVSGCAGASDTGCGGSDTVAVMTDLVRDGLAVKVREVLRSDASAGSFSSAKVRAIIKQASVELLDVRTTRDDPDSSRKFCSAKLTVKVPMTVLEEANASREMARLNSINDLSADSDVEQQAATFRYDTEYSVQPTDDGKKVYVELEKDNALFEVLTQLFASSAVAETVRNARAEQDQLATAQAREEKLAQDAETAAFSEQAIASLAEAQAINKLQSERIGAAWQALLDSQRSELLPLQRAWIKRKLADCRVEAAGSDQRTEAREANRLNCDSRLTAERANWLISQRRSEAEQTEE